MPNLGFIGAMHQKVPKDVKHIADLPGGPAVRCPTTSYAGVAAR